jgi:branched-chain amino acid transport system ATP-binding protein
MNPEESPDFAVEVSQITAGYGDLHILRDLSLSIPRRSVELILGRNGTGKTTLLSAISGTVKVSQGEIYFGTKPLSRLPAYTRARAGIALVPQGGRLFRGLTVRQNIAIGTYGLRLGRRERARVCAEMLARFPVLADREAHLAASLSGGQRQMLAIAQALAARPTLLMLDEPSAGLAPSIVDEVFREVAALKDSDMTVLVVEQLAERALLIADHVCVLNEGRITASGLPEEFTDKRVLHAAYFGETMR